MVPNLCHLVLLFLFWGLKLKCKKENNEDCSWGKWKTHFDVYFTGLMGITLKQTKGCDRLKTSIKIKKYRKESSI